MGKVRVGGNLGVVTLDRGYGIGTNIDVRYNLLDNFNVGLTFGNANMFKNEIMFSSVYGIKGQLIETKTYLVSSDFYFNSGYSNYITFLGFSAGLFNVSKLYLPNYTSLEELNAYDYSETKFGCVFRTGFEHKKFRFAIEYNLIPKTSFTDINERSFGLSNNNYFDVTLGFYVGGGKWNKRAHYYINPKTNKQEIRII
jgi:outer membrane protein X